MRFGLISSAIAAVIGIACLAGSANATTLLVSGNCVSVADSHGCLFTGTINDEYYSTNLAGHPNSYLNAVDAYNSYVTANPGHGPTINIAAIGESAGNPAAGDPNILQDPIVDTNCANPETSIAGCNVIGMVTFTPGTKASNQLRAGTWTLFVSQNASFVAVDGGNKFDLYELDTPSTSGQWNTYDIPTGNNGLSHPQLYRLVLFSDLSTAAVPEPATWAMLLLGFGLTGASMRLRRKAAVAAA